MSMVLRSFEACDAEALMSALERDPGHACGGVPAAAVMRASRASGRDRRRRPAIRRLR